MLRRAFFALLACAVAGVAGSAHLVRASSGVSRQTVAQTTPPPFSCFFAGFNQFNNLINSGIACATPGPMPTASPFACPLTLSGTFVCLQGASPTPQPGDIDLRQFISSLPGLTVTEQSTPSTADLVDVLGFNQPSCSSTENVAVTVCIRPSPNANATPGSQQALDVYDTSAVGCGICLRANALGDGFFEGMGGGGTIAGYGLDIVNYNSANVNPMLVLNNCGCGSTNQTSTFNFGLAFIRDRGHGPTIGIEDEKTGGSGLTWNQSVSNDPETLLYANMGQSGGSFTGSFINFKIDSVPVFQVNNTGGVKCGAPGTINCIFTLQNNTSTDTHYTFDTNTACVTGAQQLYAFKTNGTTEQYFDCLGDAYFNRHIGQITTGNYAGTCAMSTSTSCTFSITSGYANPPVCISNEQGTDPIASACKLTGSTVTITAASSNSDTWGATLIGNPN